MGAGPSLDGEVAEAKQIMGDFLAKFAKNYAMLYAVGLAKEKLKETEKAAAGPKWELLKAAKEVPAPDRKQGHMLKRSVHLKKWNKRFFVVRGNWLVDFWAEEEHFTQGKKPRGTLNLSGMHVVHDPNDNGLTKLKKIAEKCKLDLSALPKPEEFPEHSLEIEHETRTCTLLQCESAEDHKAWVKMLEQCRYHARSLNVDEEDKVHHKIFRTAVWRTRWDCDIWGWFSSGGGEEQYLTDCINDAIMWAVMPRVDEKLTMPWAVRSRVRNAFKKNVNTAVFSAVKPAWGAAYEGVKKVRPELAEKIGAGVAPIGEAIAGIKAKIMEKADKPSKEGMSEKVLPHLSPLLDLLVAPVNEAFKLVLQAYDDALVKGKEKYKPDEDRYHLVRHNTYSKLYWEADRKLWDLFDTVWDMRKVFSDLSPHAVLSRARRRVRKHLKNALYTFETRLEEAGGVEHWDKVAAETRELLKKDCLTGIARTIGRMLYGCVEAFWETLVIKPLRTVVRPLGDAIPDAVKQFVDPEDVLERTLNSVLLQACCNCFEPYAKKISL